MNKYLMEGRYYQFVGRIREWIGTVAHNELEVDLGRRDQFGQHWQAVVTTNEKGTCISQNAVHVTDQLMRCSNLRCRAEC